MGKCWIDCMSLLPIGNTCFETASAIKITVNIFATEGQAARQKPTITQPHIIFLKFFL